MERPDTAHPEIQLTPCESSLIHAHGYDAATQTLALQFKAKGGPGATYHYADVPPEMYAALQTSDSVGRFFGSEIKNNPAHPHTRVAEPPEPEKKPDQEQAAA
jgi:hypothetical protein